MVYYDAITLPGNHPATAFLLPLCIYNSSQKHFVFSFFFCIISTTSHLYLQNLNYRLLAGYNVHV